MPTTRSHSLPTVKALRGLGAPKVPFLVVDPGRKTGLAIVNPIGPPFEVWTCKLDELPLTLLRTVGSIGFVVCEDYTLSGGKMASFQAGSDMPSSLGIGMCWMACVATDKQLFLANRGSKSAGHLNMSNTAAEAYSRCRNDHERDVIDLASYVQREMGLTNA